jgi:hypothetical protein
MAPLIHCLNVGDRNVTKCVMGITWPGDAAAHTAGGSRHTLTGTPAYAAWGERWLDDVLGTNARGVSLIVGDGTVFPGCMRHQIANDNVQSYSTVEPAIDLTALSPLALA